MEIGAEELALFADDGRVFYDLDALIQGYEEHLAELRLVASTPAETERASGVAHLIDAIREDLAYLRADYAGYTGHPGHADQAAV